MTTPQNPGDGETPQDPSDPQNPYGTPPPPPPPYGEQPPPSAAPSTPPPYGEQPPPPAVPPAAPAYGQPAAPSYGQPAAPSYGQPGQPAYGVPGYPSPMPGPAQPGKGMAITALILSFICCLDVVGIILAIVVLVRSRDGQNRGKGLAIAALVIGVITLVATIAGSVALVNYAKDFKDVDSLKAGDCFTAKGLTDDSESGVTQIRSVGCSDKHDGEVLATSNLSSDQAASYGQASPVEICTPSVSAAGSADLLADPEKVLIALTQDASPSSGDKLVCVIANADGSKLTSKLG
ncbi:DUF4190 domain-containing protein [Nocardioides halotolerans]|uniref:DUF4190 domain-containing protein n=1 Tax=Nocardioides halotolerans TaxID=433660 RepID=UPI0003FBDD91|nr:DUF4190 domain-containing protein [Nocardioides halotolerans]